MEWLGIDTQLEDRVKQAQLMYEDKLSNIIKPCWELKFCPYGPLVEDYPLPPPLLSEYRESREHTKRCLELGEIGKNYDIYMDDERKDFIERKANGNYKKYYVKKRSKFEEEAQCSEFGHLCPAYFVSESVTETEVGRNRSRRISNAALIRVTRRDNNTCQICGNILLDREIEIDYIIPFSRGGSSDESNLRVTCMKCNRRKGNKVLNE